MAKTAFCRAFLCLLFALVAGSASADPYPRWTVMVGDSNTYLGAYNNTGAPYNCPLVNAGKNGAPIKAIASLSWMASRITKPYVAHVMLGTNDLYFEQDSDEWLSMADDLTSIVDFYLAVGAKVVLWKIPPFGPSAPASFTFAKRDAINTLIYGVYVGEGGNAAGVYYDGWSTGITGGDGYAIPGYLQADGIHFLAAAHASRLARLQVWAYYWAQNNVPCK